MKVGGLIPPVLALHTSTAVIGQAACAIVNGSTRNSGSVPEIIQVKLYTSVAGSVTAFELGPQ